MLHNTDTYCSSTSFVHLLQMMPPLVDELVCSGQSMLSQLKVGFLTMFTVYQRQLENLKYLCICLFYTAYGLYVKASINHCLGRDTYRTAAHRKLLHHSGILSAYPMLPGNRDLGGHSVFSDLCCFFSSHHQFDLYFSINKQQPG